MDLLEITSCFSCQGQGSLLSSTNSHLLGRYLSPGMVHFLKRSLHFSTKEVTLGVLSGYATAVKSNVD